MGVDRNGGNVATLGILVLTLRIQVVTIHSFGEPKVGFLKIYFLNSSERHLSLKAINSYA